jgi:hypothetical protein
MTNKKYISIESIDGGYTLAEEFHKKIDKAVKEAMDLKLVRLTNDKDTWPYTVVLTPTFARSYKEFSAEEQEAFEQMLNAEALPTGKSASGYKQEMMLMHFMLGEKQLALAYAYTEKNNVYSLFAMHPEPLEEDATFH